MKSRIDSESDSVMSEFESRLKAAQKGDEQSLAFLIEASEKRLHRFCYYLSCDPSAAQDLTHDTLLRAMERLRDFTGPASGFMSWLFKIARNLFIDQVRRESRFRKDPSTQDLLEGVSDPHSDAQLSLEVRSALDQMDPEDRILLLLVDLEGCSYEEAAQAAGIQKKSIKTNIYRARQRFLKIFKAE